MRNNLDPFGKPQPGGDLCISRISTYRKNHSKSAQIPNSCGSEEKHKEALETLRYGILHGDGYVVLTGDVGTGKTTLAMALAKDLSHKVIVARIAYPDVEVLDFLKLISTAYGINSDVQAKPLFAIALSLS